MNGDGSDTPRQAIAAAEAAARSERWREALAAYGRAARLAGEDVDHAPARVDALRGAAAIRIRLAEWQEGVRDLAESRLLAARIGDERRIAQAENTRGVLEFERGNWDEAARRYRAARRNAGAVEDVSLLMRIENNEGALWSARGDRRRAERHFRRALKRFEEREEDPCGARVLNNLGMVLTEEGRFEEAESSFERALAQCKRSGDLALGATVMINRARLALRREEPLHAHAIATTAAAFAHRLGNGPLAADAACLLGAVARSQRRWSEAERYLDEAIERAGDGRAPMAEAEAWEERGRLEADREREAEAAEAFRQARRCWLGLGSDVEAERLERQVQSLVA